MSKCCLRNALQKTLQCHIVLRSKMVVKLMSRPVYLYCNCSRSVYDSDHNTTRLVDVHNTPKKRFFTDIQVFVLKKKNNKKKKHTKLETKAWMCS